MQYHTDVKGLDSVIGCQDSDSLILVKKGLLTPLNEQRRHRDSLYDVRELKNIVTQITEADSTNEMYSLSSYEHLFSLFNASWQDILLAVFTFKLEVVLTGEYRDTILSRCYVSRFRILRFLVKHLRSQAKSDIQISKESVSSILAISAGELKQLAKAGILTPIEYNNYGRAYHLKECTDFLKSYWSLRRWATIHGLCEDRLVQFLEEHHIKSTYSRFIYSKSYKLKYALRNYHQDNSSEK